ncbi:hypothetical protein KQI84_02465 [bacterium]|nr:hypothetical protein [bacterium]
MKQIAILPITICLLLLAANAPHAMADEIHCSLCGQIISGQYMEYKTADGKKLSVCQHCADTKPKCALCGIPTNNRAGGGKPALCDNCRRTAMSCDRCGHLITGKYVTYRPAGKSEIRVCERCEQALLKCSVCGVPYKATDLRRSPNGQIWCTDCLAKAKICNLCKNPINGSYYEIPFLDGQWCADCFEHKLHCSTCGRPMDEPAASLFDGRHVCRECYKTSVTGTEKLEEIRDELVPEFRKLFGRPVHPPPIRAVAASELRGAMVEGEIYLPEDEEGKVPIVREMGLFRVRDGVQEILILDTMPEDMAWETVAHELAHAWHYQQHPMSRDPVIVEGFAQWTAEQLCYKTYHRTTLDRLRNREDFYGLAFRTMQQVELKDGTRGVLKALEENELPSGVGGY